MTTKSPPHKRIWANRLINQFGFANIATIISSDTTIKINPNPRLLQIHSNHLHFPSIFCHTSQIVYSY